MNLFQTHVNLDMDNAWSAMDGPYVHPSSLALRHEHDVCNDYRSNSYWTLCVTVRHFMSNVFSVNNCVLRVRKYKIVVVNVLCRR